MKAFNLTILQLVLPLASMSKAEYKEVYGIDLDNIDIEKVILVQEEGSKNKYFVDEIKATEEGFDIYAGGKILSIGDSVSVTNNAYSVENSKPLYFHPISLLLTNNYAFSIIIINNEPEAYTKSTLPAELNRIRTLAGETCRFPATGGVDDEGTPYPSYNLEVSTLDNFRIYYFKGTALGAKVIDFTNASMNLFDGVNKIN